MVASAGNSGFNLRGVSSAHGSSYQNISITDPATNRVITVGSTHGSLPSNLGSATSLLADQRQTAVLNLDLLAPGEGINGPIPLINDVEADYKSYDRLRSRPRAILSRRWSCRHPPALQSL